MVRNLLPSPVSLYYYTYGMSRSFKYRVHCPCQRSFPVTTYRVIYLNLRSPLAPRTTMQDVVYEHVALCAKIIRTVRASVPTQWADPIRPRVHSRASFEVVRARVRVSVCRGISPPRPGECGRLERPRTRVTRRTRVGCLLHRHTSQQNETFRIEISEMRSERERRKAFTHTVRYVLTGNK